MKATTIHSSPAEYLFIASIGNAGQHIKIYEDGDLISLRRQL